MIAKIILEIPKEDFVKNVFELEELNIPFNYKELENTYKEQFLANKNDYLDFDNIYVKIINEENK